MRALALAAGFLLSVQAGPAMACRAPLFHTYFILNAPPASLPPDALVLEVSHRRLPPDHYPYSAFRARVVRVIQGAYRGSTIIIAPQGGSSCTYLSEKPEGARRYVVGELVRGRDGVLRLRPRPMRSRPIRPRALRGS